LCFVLMLLEVCTTGQCCMFPGHSAVDDAVNGQQS
jgi:hypothetical protein